MDWWYGLVEGPSGMGWWYGLVIWQDYLAISWIFLSEVQNIS